MKLFRSPSRDHARIVALVASCLFTSAATAAGFWAGGSFQQNIALPSLPWLPGGDSAREVSTPQVALTGKLSDSVKLADSLIGHSGKLRFRLIEEDSATAVREVLASAAGSQGFHWIPLLPFGSKKLDRIGGYRLGYWPAERRRILSSAYANPLGFIQVTPENRLTQVSEHFHLGDFLTHDQQAVWPKYVVLREALIDKLELVVADLKAHGTLVRDIRVMSGFRTPQYNAQGVGKGGRARDSRHQFGDAADVFVDNDGDGRMDDLDRDGRSDVGDARVILQAVNRVERSYPDLVGGAGLYSANGSHGPFIHIDARGQRARWGGA